MKLILPGRLADQIAAEAKAAHPRECCGLIEGIIMGSRMRAAALHPARNLSADQDCFEIDPADHIAAARTARDNGHILIGCYHSHPQGRAMPSARDLAGATQDDFLWLIAAPEGLAAFVYSAGGFAAVGLATGADLVTSSL
jgi:proteasome lid subunit RPN8/RPN11